MIQHVVNSFSKKEREDLIAFFKSKDTIFKNNKLIINRKVCLGCNDCCFKNGEILLDNFSICNSCNDKWVYNVKVLNLILQVYCTFCNNKFDIHVNQKDFNEYKTGSYYIQDKLNYLDKHERELVISGTCKDCWDKLFKDIENG